PLSLPVFEPAIEDRRENWRYFRTLLKVPVDPHDFRELVGNLLENACKWARSRIQVSAVRQNGHSRLVIEDDGPGVSPERLPDLTRRGVRLDRLKPGSGLGLAIVSEIAAVYDLTLSLENRLDGGFSAKIVFREAIASRTVHSG
ncbi:ATP-binding protein, partial [Rhizobium sp. SIMBA_035]